MKDYDLQIKIRNAPLLNIMRLNGVTTVAELSRGCGVPQVTIGKYMNLKKPPINKNGEWGQPILEVSKFLGVLPEMLFPEQHLEKPLDRNVIELQVSLKQLEMMSCNQHYIIDADAEEKQEQLEALADAIDSLGGRQAGIIRKRFGIGCEPKTLKQVAYDYSISTERVRQIEGRALRHLRHPSRAKKFRGLCQDNFSGAS